jgi:hypothetical protein
VHFELFAVEEHRRPAVGRDPEHLTFVAAAREQRAVRRRHERPEKRGVRFVERRRGGTECQPAVGVDGEVFDLTLEELGFGGDLPESGNGGHRGHAGGAREYKRGQSHAESSGHGGSVLESSKWEVRSSK